MVAVQVELGDEELRTGGRDLLFDAGPLWSDPASQQYDVSPDDQRFLMLRGEGSPNSVMVTWNWLEQARTAVQEANR